jgi:hypothetical protein
VRSIAIFVENLLKNVPKVRSTEMLVNIAVLRTFGTWENLNSTNILRLCRFLYENPTKVDLIEREMNKKAGYPLSIGQKKVTT